MSHLQMVKGLYRVRIVVPPALRPVIGRESLVKALGRRNCALSNCLGAIGETGQTALRNAAASGFGKLFALTQ